MILEAIPVGVEAKSSDRLTLHSDWLQLKFEPLSTPRSADFHYIWLRHQCEQDRHPLTGERIVDPSEFRSDIRPRAAWLDTKNLFVQWNDGRESTYSLQWLQANAYAPNREAVPPPPSELRWIERNFRDYASTGNLLAELKSLITTRGIVILRDYRPNDSISADDTEALITLLAHGSLRTTATHFGRIEDLRTDNSTNQNTDQLGYTDSPVNLHTDQPFLQKPPRYQALHCVQPAQDGGDNFAVDALAAARFIESTDAEAFRLLTTVPVRFHRKQKAFESLVVAPILTMEGPLGFQVRSSYFTMDPFERPFAEMTAWYRAYNVFSSLIRDPRHQYRAKLNAGDVLLYDNYRMLHARTGFKGARWMRGVYFDRAD